MPQLIQHPVRLEAHGQPRKIIEEFVGRLATQTSTVSIARMRSPSGWSEPGQTPDFDEYTVVLAGLVRVATKAATIDVSAGQAIIVRRGEWVQYSTPGGAEYIAVCMPAFTPDAAHRDQA